MGIPPHQMLPFIDLLSTGCCDADLPICHPDLLPEGAKARGWTRGECLIHTYEELAQHHGHMEITRDLLLAAGPAGGQSPDRTMTT